MEHIKNLELIGADPVKLEEYRLLRAKALETDMRMERVRGLIIARGGNIHGVNVKATAKRRAKRKVHNATKARVK
jgi:hypothetical protein